MDDEHSESPWISVLQDCTADVSGREQLFQLSPYLDECILVKCKVNICRKLVQAQNLKTHIRDYHRLRIEDYIKITNLDDLEHKRESNISPPTLQGIIQVQKQGLNRYHRNNWHHTICTPDEEGELSSGEDEVKKQLVRNNAVLVYREESDESDEEEELSSDEEEEVSSEKDVVKKQLVSNDAVQVCREESDKSDEEEELASDDNIEDHWWETRSSLTCSGSNMSVNWLKNSNLKLVSFKAPPSKFDIIITENCKKRAIPYKKNI